MEVNGQRHVLAALLLEESVRHPSDRRLCGLQSRSECYGEEKNLAPAGNRTPSIQPVAVPTEKMECMYVIDLYMDMLI
jgi:hypothetical protein